MAPDDARPGTPRPDLPGEAYLGVLARLHAALAPKTYFEIGVDKGDTLNLSACDSIGVDPAFQLTLSPPLRQSALHLYQMTSDNYFARHSPSETFGRPIEMAFLDGMHRCEFLLRDFINTERHCRKNSVVMLHDCLPVEAGMTDRVIGGGGDRIAADHRKTWWTGDVWRTALLLKRRRRDLRMLALDAGGTGLLILTNLDPDNSALGADYAEHVDEMLSWDLERIGVDAYFEEIGVTSTAALQTHEQITARYWL